jgi:hypothetical protein
MRLPIQIALIALATAFALPARAAINPAEYTRNVPDQMRVRETARIVQEYDVDGARHRRVTVMGEVVEQKNATGPRVGKSVLIDYTVDLDDRRRGSEAHSKTYGNMPGPQFMYEPDPPVLDGEGMFWANVAPAGGRWGNVNRHAGAVVDIDGHDFSGEVYVPVSGQYSFEAIY